MQLSAGTRQYCWAPQHSRARLRSAAGRVIHTGFSTEELHILHDCAPALFAGEDVQLLPASADALAQPVASLHQAELSAEGVGSRPQLGRMLYFVGDSRRHAAGLNEALVDLGMAPAIIAASVHKHAELSLGDALARVREAHASHHRLLQPLQVGPAPPVHVGELAAVHVAMNVALDAGYVPTSDGGERADEAHVVVLDGLVTEAERGQLLAWLTAEGHDPAAPPPGERWGRTAVDRAGAGDTWGLHDHVLTELREAPPPALVALQGRLAALYPELLLCHMPAEAMDEEDMEREDQPLSSFVGNAVLPGDPCEWHIDASPTMLPPGAPWVQHWSYYTNREAHKPLFVSVLVYLSQPPWPNDWHGETLFLDPETGTGVFVQPRPGRVVLMEQDMQHRINAPSAAARGPRYSLVLKTVWLPRPPAAEQEVAAGAPASRESSCAAQGGQLSISRAEWGEPQRIGSASSLGVRGWPAAA